MTVWLWRPCRLSYPSCKPRWQRCLAIWPCLSFASNHAVCNLLLFQGQCRHKQGSTMGSQTMVVGKMARMKGQGALATSSGCTLPFPSWELDSPGLFFPLPLSLLLPLCPLVSFLSSPSPSCSRVVHAPHAWSRGLVWLHKKKFRTDYTLAFASWILFLMIVLS